MSNVRLKQTNIILNFLDGQVLPGTDYKQLTVGQLIAALQKVDTNAPVNVYFYDDIDGGTQLDEVEQLVYSDGSQAIWLRQV